MSNKEKNGNKIKIGRNDICPCGSGKKYKKCCLIKDREINKSQSVEHALMDDGNLNGKIKDNESAEKMIKSLEGMKAVKNATEMGLLDWLIPLGLDKDSLGDAFSKLEEFEGQISMLNIPDKFNEHFVDRGWIAHESINFKAMKKAAELADENKFDEAEEILIATYEENLELSIRMIDWMIEIKPRNKLLQLAYEDYLAERYHSCILILFTIIDGFVADTKEIDGNKCFFAEGEEIYAWDSIAAHQTGLTELRKLLYQNRGKTTTDEIDIPYRNGILHGRDLNYANKKVAVKLWATLFALKDGIIEIKKGKTPEEPKKFDLIKTAQLVRDNATRKNISEEWKPRKLKINVDFPSEADSSEYFDESPEKALVEFFGHWKSRNWGKMVEKLYYRFFEENTLGKKVFELKTGIFNGKELTNYSMISINDSSPMISDIKVTLTIRKEDHEISKNIDFRMVYERENGEMEFSDMKNGSWKIYNGIYDIEGF